MKRILLVAGIIAGGLALSSAQEPIKVTTTLHNDGTRTVLKVDPDARSAEATTYFAEDKIRQRVVYELDEQNQPASGTFYDGKGRFILRSVYKRDAANRVLEQHDYTADNKLVRRLLYEYGGGGKVSKVRTFDANGVEIQAQGGSKSRRR